jgi:hypothetical protein
MGEVVLEAGPNAGDLHVYSHCLRGSPGGVGIVAINLSRTAPAPLALSRPAVRYSLTAGEIEAKTVELNGRNLRVGTNDIVPMLTGAAVSRGTQKLPPASITFFSVATAKNRMCR